MICFVCPGSYFHAFSIHSSAFLKQKNFSWYKQTLLWLGNDTSSTWTLSPLGEEEDRVQMTFFSPPGHHQKLFSSQITLSKSTAHSQLFTRSISSLNMTSASLSQDENAIERCCEGLELQLDMSGLHSGLGACWICDFSKLLTPLTHICANTCRPHSLYSLLIWKRRTSPS